MKSFFAFALILALFVSCSQKPQPIVEWKSIERSLQTQMISIADSGAIELPEGHFMFTKGLTMDGKKNILIKGKGMDKTVLSFKNQTEGAQGFMITNGVNITLEDFTIEDAKGDNLKVSETRNLTLRRIRAQWTAGPSSDNGAYALYPVLCKNVLMEECEAIGSSDAGIYVGQSDSVIIRNNKAYWNVAGIESENSRWVEIYGNEAWDNTGGLLIFDLPGLTQYGHTTKVYDNFLHDNNHENFATPGNVVATVPPGTGIIILATHDLEMTQNKIVDNTTVGTAVVSYEMVAALSSGEQQQGTVGSTQTVNNNYKMDTLYNAFPQRIHIHHNTYENSNWFPTLSHDIGKLFFFKSFMSVPDIAFDGIRPEDKPDAELCIHDNGEITFMNLDAAHEFKALSKDASKFNCVGIELGKK